MNGLFFARSVSVWTRFGDDLQIDLRRGCRTLATTVGILDDGDFNSLTQVDIYGDDRNLWTNQVPFGESFPVNVSVVNVLRLRVGSAFLTGDTSSYGYPGLGSARVYCRF